MSESSVRQRFVSERAVRQCDPKRNALEKTGENLANTKEISREQEVATAIDSSVVRACVRIAEEVTNLHKFKSSYSVAQPICSELGRAHASVLTVRTWVVKQHASKQNALEKKLLMIPQNSKCSLL